MSAVPYSILAPAEDSFVLEDSASQNEGTDVLVTVRSKKKKNHMFVKLDVSTIPSGSTVSSATLTMCATAVPHPARIYEAFRVTASWSESTITWNNQPAADASFTDTATTPGTPGCMTWTVTPDVQAWVDGSSNDGWRIGDASEGSGPNKITAFRSREDTAVPADQPSLRVDYTVPWSL